MAWNTPGSSGPGSNPSGPDGRRPQRPRKPGGGLDTLFDSMRGLFGGGGSSIWRWVAIVFGLWLVFSTFVSGSDGMDIDSVNGVADFSKIEG